MCTLSFVPQSNNGFLLTSNRDEAVARKGALPPKTYESNGIQVTYPKDGEANGTWLAAADNGFMLCLLNGAFTKHHRQPPYKHSRGLVILHFFQFNDVNRFYDDYDFERIEPFTLVFVNSHTQSITEMRWDGERKYLSEKEWNAPHIWSSATLYEPEVVTQREIWFHDFLAENPHADLNNLLYFHHFGGGADEHNRFLMNRNNVLKTISITGIKKCEQNTFMHYEDLLSGSSTILTL